MSTIVEILNDVNKDISVLPRLYANHNYLRNALEAAFLPQKKLNLPEGDPPYRPSTANEYQLKGSFWQVVRKIDVFQRTDLKPLKIETAFIHALESMSKKEAEILIAIKDQNLNKLFPNITYENLINAGYRIADRQFKEPPVVEEKKEVVVSPVVNDEGVKNEVVKPRRGRPPGTKNPPKTDKVRAE